MTKEIIHSIGKICLRILALLIIVVMSINLYMVLSTESQLKSELKSIPENQYEVGVVLGAGVRNSYPTPILQERLDAAVELYKAQKVHTLIMSGADWGRDYNEVEVMKSYAVSKGVVEQDIILDHAGYITYDSVMRARDVYNYDKVIFITQRYHMPRTLYLANKAHIDAIGFMPTEVKYNMQWKYSSREYLARVKNFLLGIVQPDTYRTGEPSWVDHT